MSNSSSPWCCGGQRPPLQPRGPPSSSNSMKVPSNSVPVPVTAVSTVGCKRHSIDSSPSKSENEPIAPFSNKRQRTKSGNDAMEVTMPVTCSESSKTGVDYCNALKSETSPLCERNIRTSKLDVVDPHVDKGHSILDNGSVSELSNNGVVLTDNNQERLAEPSASVVHNNGSLAHPYNGSGSRDLPDISPVDHSTLSTESNGFSQHCSSTLEYVTQLPEGCSGDSQDIVNQHLDTSRESDGELDDDNYLDSSEGEEDEDLALNTNEEDESCGEDDQSIVSTITVGSTCSLRSVASEAVSTIYMNEHGVAANEDGSLLYSGTPSMCPLTALNPSLFSNIPPAVNFCQYNESTEKKPPAIAKLLKWKFSTITPLIVRKTVINSGFKITKRTVMWSGTWGKHMKSPCFKTIKDFQKINHFPGTFQIGRKDKLWKNFAKLQSKFGKEEFGFIPKTFVLPGDVNALKVAFEKEGVKKKWIVKPPASARGTGIQVVNKWSQMPTDTSVVVQRYISRPYLINDTKFDMRIYVLVTSFHPLILYLYQDGLVRFASVQYNKASKTLGDRFMHLTNYSVNKNSSSYTHNEDAGQCQGHKWTLRTLWGYLKARDVDTGALWSRIADLVIKTMISGENDIVIRTRKNIKSRYCCYELFGFDVILDEKLRPWLLEVNISPSLHSASPLDHSVKGPLISDLLNIASFHIPDRLGQEEQDKLISELQLGEKVTNLTLDRRLYTRLLTPEEQSKHVNMNSLPRSQYLTAALEKLTPDDVRHLTMFQDQLHRAGKFTCIFPTADTFQYFGFLDKPRYYNRLFDAWETTYSGCREKGIEVLEALCKEKRHLIVPTRFKMPKTTVSTAVKSTLRQPTTQSTEAAPTSGTEAKAQDANESVETSTSILPVANSPKKPVKLKIKKKKGLKVSVNPLKPAALSSITTNLCGMARESDTEEYEEVDEFVEELEANSDNMIGSNHNMDNTPHISAKITDCNEDKAIEPSEENNCMMDVVTEDTNTEGLNNSNSNHIAKSNEDKVLEESKVKCCEMDGVSESTDIVDINNSTNKLLDSTIGNSNLIEKEIPTNESNLPDNSSVRRKMMSDDLEVTGDTAQNDCNKP